MRVAELELELDVFTGPFDLLTTLVLREEIDLLEVDLAEIVLAYIDHLERSGELSGADPETLEVTTEFLVLIAALLELKSRLMLPSDEQELIDIEPGEAAEELLARMLQAKRYRGAATWLAQRLEDESGHRFRSAPLPAGLRRAPLQGARAVYDPGRLGAALGELLREPQPVDLSHVTNVRVSVGERLSHLRTLLSRGSVSFDDAVAGADRVTVAVTLWALLELYRRGEASWRQAEPFSEITIDARAPAQRGSGDGERGAAIAAASGSAGAAP